MLPIRGCGRRRASKRGRPVLRASDARSRAKASGLTPRAPCTDGLLGLSGRRWSMTRLFLTTAIAAFGILVTGGVTRGAGEQADSERRAEIVAHVGPSRTILVADVEDRISA